MSSFVPVRLNTLKGEKPLSFDVYIKLGERFLLYTRLGDSVENERIEGLKDKRVKQMFITEDAEKSYQSFLENKLNDTANDKSLSAEAKAEVAKDASSSAVEGVYENPESASAYVTAEKTLNGLIEIITKNDDVVKAIFNKEADKDQIHLKHALNVSSFGIKLATEMKMTPQEVTDIGMAGYFHDIGMIKMAEEDKALFQKDYAEFTPDEWERYKTHPAVGAELFKGKEYATAAVAELIESHEELKSGAGFPKGLTNLTGAQEVLSLVCNFDRRTTYLKKNPDELIKEMMLSELNNYDITLLKAFRKVLKNEGIVG